MMRYESGLQLVTLNYHNSTCDFKMIDFDECVDPPSQVIIDTWISYMHHTLINSIGFLSYLLHKKIFNKHPGDNFKYIQTSNGRYYQGNGM